MDSTNNVYNTLLQALLPSEIFDYFEITQVIVNDKSLDVHLDELNIIPSLYSNKTHSSKGFQKAVVIQDFPIRERAVFLHVRRRKWLIESTGKIISRDWDTVEKGTRYTKGFASFLKGLFGQLPTE